MIRNICAVVVGLIAGMALNMAILLLSVLLYPLPEGVSFGDTEAMAAHMKTLPVIALLIVMLAHLGQAFVGGLIAAIIGKNSSMLVAMIVGVLSLMAGLFNMESMSPPTWMWIELPLYLVAAWAAARIVLAIRAPAAHLD